MISFKPAGDEHFDALLELIYHHEDTYLKPILDLVQITCDQFGWLFRTTGMVYRILVNGCLAGICWVEVCSRVLHLHGLILKAAFQGQGIGTQTLVWLEEHFRSRVDQIELAVHASNPRAKALYARCGYRVVESFGSSGLFTMRKSIQTLDNQMAQEDPIMDIPIGRVTHFYNHLGVAVLKLSGEIRLGDTISILGHLTEIEQPVGSLEINHHKVAFAGPGMEVALKVIDMVRKGDLVYKVVEAERSAALE